MFFASALAPRRALHAVEEEAVIARGAYGSSVYEAVATRRGGTVAAGTHVRRTLCVAVCEVVRANAVLAERRAVLWARARSRRHAVRA